MKSADESAWFVTLRDAPWPFVCEEAGGGFQIPSALLLGGILVSLSFPTGPK
jgi:hypothetical protein